MGSGTMSLMAFHIPRTCQKRRSGSMASPCATQPSISGGRSGRSACRLGRSPPVTRGGKRGARRGRARAPPAGGGWELLQGRGAGEGNAPRKRAKPPRGHRVGGEAVIDRGGTPPPHLGSDVARRAGHHAVV